MIALFFRKIMFFFQINQMIIRLLSLNLGAAPYIDSTQRYRDTEKKGKSFVPLFLCVDLSALAKFGFAEFEGASGMKIKTSFYFAFHSAFAKFANKNGLNMILSTTPNIEGCPIKSYLGVVTGETIIGANVIKDFKASLTDFFGGRSGSYERTLQEAKNTSMNEMMQRAAAMGANAIVGIDIDYETIGQANSMLMVATSGTAVII